MITWLRQIGVDETHHKFYKSFFFGEKSENIKMYIVIGSISILTECFSEFDIFRYLTEVFLSPPHPRLIRKVALLRDVFGDLTPKQKCTCRVRAQGGGCRYGFAGWCN